jgi:DEAD/DEAH box helicase domain-containing protein
MIPTVVARQTRETVLDYLRTTFALADDRFADALFGFLDAPGGLFRGPYLDVRLPFRKATDAAVVPLDIAPSFTPYRHQLRAFERLNTQGGHRPQPTLVTTGTGSGKTECFLYPILDHCYQQRGRKGIKAILLYPMNALASDQARRLAQTIWDDDRLKGHVSAGLFIGGEGQHGAASRDHLVDQRAVLRQSPPDILLTNYRMLDFLLMRPDDQGLWKHNGPETLRFLVLDELHTYDGAQGSDVACLIRRLRARLGAPAGAICPVGTSATIGGVDQSASIQALVAFATKVFGDSFDAEGVITEDRCDMVEVLGSVVDDYEVPASCADLDGKAAATLEEWIERQVALWLPGLQGHDPVAVSLALRRHGFLRQILRALDKQLRSFEEVDAWLGEHEEGWRDLQPVHRAQLLDSFLGLVAFARTAVLHDGGQRLEPFLNVQVQVWMRELRHLVQRVAVEPQFAWASDSTPAEGRWLPIAYCRSCGAAGWATYQRESENLLQTDLSEIGRAWLHAERTCRFVAPGHADTEELFVESLHVDRLALQAHAPGAPAPEGSIPVRVGRDCSEQQRARFLGRCPDCDADGASGLSLMGSRAPSLLSVAISHLFQTGYNHDKKLLAFTDSVQDASHRAAFFGARTYRFNLRTAIQGVLEESAEDLPLVGFPERLLDWVTRKQGAQTKAVATLWPADLRDLGEHGAFVESGGEVTEDLLGVLEQRLSWEVAMEYGYAARVGRTLERTLCSTAVLDPGRLGRAAATLALELAEGDLLEAPITIDPAQVQHFLAGMLQRLRVQGGVSHPFLDVYVAQQGKWFFLTKKKQPLLSPFGSHSRLPRFLTEAPPEGRSVFPSIAAASDKPTWHRDWAARCLGVDRKERGLRELYRRALQRLVEHGVLQAHGATNGPRSYGLRRDALALTRNVTALGCSVCQDEEVVPTSQLAQWAGRTCLHYRCRGQLGPLPDRQETYYGRRYRSGTVERIFAQEHTGLLSREVRERIEDEFKSPTRPDAPNLFVCTPTLEMGVDIGDLSATVLCSVPPTTANYLQRIGRAGRRTGNALCLTMALERPHDLYFQADPLQMMRGRVLPPGCFLDAPEMLRRQLVAFAMDAWARQETELPQIPRKASLVLSGDGSARFPGRFLQFYREHEQALAAQFLAVFDSQISQDNSRRLREFAGSRNIDDVVRGAFDRLQEERQDLQVQLRRTRDRLTRLHEDPEQFEDPEAEKRQLEDSERMIARLMRELGDKYPLNVLTDAGVLPNYAFPEPGVHFKAVLQGDGTDDQGRREFKAYEYTRSSSSALREFAPWNTFYAEGHKLVIKELDLGTRANKLYAPWRLCAACHHAELVIDGAAIAPACPRCRDPRWQDAGQLRQLLKFQRARTLDTELAAASSDESDDREEAWYQVEDLIDVGREHVHGHAKVIASLPFGIELLKRLSLREINFGNLATRGFGGASFEVAGRGILQDGFVTCVDCGRVREPEKTAIDHAPWCLGKRTGPRAAAPRESLETVFLFREIESEAIRVLVPVAEIDQERRLWSFRAALELGFRRRFAGDPRHLQIRLQDEPLAGEGRRRFLVVFDTVPGGTGYLSELWHGDHFRDVLELAWRTLEDCACQRRDPPADGCYQCLYAYQQQRHLDQLSSREAREMLREILVAWPTIEAQHTLSDVSLDTRLESELERYFLRELRAHAERRQWGWAEGVRGGEVFWTLTVNGVAWEIQAQADLGLRQGALIACRPDFLFKPANGDPAIPPVAVFCDGLEYHACPGRLEGRVGDDVQKRAGLLASGSYLFWSVTWKDVTEFRDSESRTTAPGLFRDLDARRLGATWQKLGVTLPRDIGERPAMSMLLEFLGRPERAAWQLAAEAATVAWLACAQSVAPETLVDLEGQLREAGQRFVAAPTYIEAGGTQLARWHADAWMAALGYCSTAAIQRGEFFEARLTLRLFDEAEARSATDFEPSWRAFLQTWNLLQFHPGCRVWTSEAIQLESDHAPAVEVPASAVALAADLRTPADDLDLILDPQARTIVRRLIAGGAKSPVAGFELLQGEAVAGMAELAWPEARVAVLVSSQLEDRAAFESAGWQIVSLDFDALAKALPLAP